MKKRKPYSPNSAIGLSAYWARQTKEERSARAQKASRGRWDKREKLA